MIAGAASTARVAFADDFLARLGSFRARARSVRDSPWREGAGRGRLLGVGEEFVGYRPYRAGEDLRQLDWPLYARSRRPFVRATRREASERWALLLDTSASMGVGVAGQPGKLQRAAEVALALAAVGVGLGARVRLVLSGGKGPTREGPEARRASDLAAWMASLQACVAEGNAGLAALLAEPGRFAGVGRVFALGDLFDLEPASAMAALVRRGRELSLAALLAPDELQPPADATIEWTDPEGGGRRVVTVDRGTRAADEDLLAERLEAWDQAAGRHRVLFGCWSASEAFETIAGGLLGG